MRCDLVNNPTHDFNVLSLRHDNGSANIVKLNLQHDSIRSKRTIYQSKQLNFMSTTERDYYLGIDFC